MRYAALTALSLSLLSCREAGCDQDVAAPTVAASALEAPSDPPGFYLGRELAPTMSHEGAPWLVRSEREAEEKTSRMLEELHLEPGDVACDIGAGNGYHTLRMAEVVGEKGRVFAVDVQREMLDMLRARAKEAGVTNVQPVLGALDDPHLPAGGCDLILMVDVYHELSDPKGMLAHLRAALNDGGTMALVEFRAEDPEVPIKPLHKMSKKQILREMTANRFELLRSYDGLPWQHLMVFAPQR